MNMSDFFYTITKEVIILKVFYENQINYIFPHIDQGFYAIIFKNQQTVN